MGTATIIAFCFFHALKNPTANIALTYILAVFLVARFTDGYSFGLFSSFVASSASIFCSRIRISRWISR